MRLIQRFLHHPAWSGAVTFGFLGISISEIGEYVRGLEFRSFAAEILIQLTQGVVDATIIALILSSVIFAIGHKYQGPSGMLDAGFMGIYYGLTAQALATEQSGYDRRRSTTMQVGCVCLLGESATDHVEEVRRHTHVERFQVVEAGLDPGIHVYETGGADLSNHELPHAGDING